MGDSRHHKLVRWSVLAMLVLLLAITGTQVIGLAFDIPAISLFAALKKAQTYEVRSRLLMEAISKVGTCSMEDTAKLWADGLVGRSAAMQYAAMDEALRETYAARLETLAPNWVTGISSPYVAGYAIDSIIKKGKDEADVSIRFRLMTSTGPAGEYRATLHIARQGDFWRITMLETDEALEPYTLF